MPEVDNRRASHAWKGYALAVTVTAGVILIRLGVDRWLGIRLSLPLCGLAAVVACVWRAGTWPALMATALTTGWYVLNFGVVGLAGWFQIALYAAEAGIFAYYGKQLVLARDQAARGENWQRHLVQTAGEGIWMVDPAGAITYANPRMAEILGCGVEQIEGRTVDAFLFPEDLQAERIRFQNRLASSKEQFDRRLRRSDGSEVWTLACSSPWSHRGKDAGLLTMMTDITERKMAEQALRRSERKFRELFENILEGVYQTSPDGRILAANPELLRMLGFSSYEELNVVGVVRDTFVDLELHQSLRDRLERDGSYANVEFQLRTRDQRIITVRENARVVRDENGVVLYYEGTLTDITEALRLGKQLRRAQEMEALGRLAGGIAEDFRRIGGGMMAGLGQALAVLPGDSPARDSLAAVARSIRSAEALTRQILDFSQRQGGEREARYEAGSAVDLNALIIQLGPELCRLVSPENCFELILCENETAVRADAKHIQQIVTDFVIQARGFGGGTNKIELATAVDPSEPSASGGVQSGSFVSLSVTGRPSADGTRDDSATPLPWTGVATSQAILAQYGGTMTSTVEAATAEFGAGIRFSLYLRRVNGGQHPLRTIETAAGEHGGFTDAGTVLLVEEEPLIRELSRDMLERQGFRVLTAGNAGEAERLARGPGHIDVLITEWAEDGDQGGALVRRLREMRPELHVLYMVGHSQESTDQIPGSDGIAVVQKPFSGDALGRKIRQLLRPKSES